MTAPPDRPQDRVALDRIALLSFLRALRRAELRPISAAMLSVLAARPGRIVAYAELVDGIYGSAAGPDDPLDNFRVLAHRLRKRGVPIIAHKGRGYSYRPSPSSPSQP